MKKRNITIRVLIYLILTLSTFFNLYSIKQLYESSNNFMLKNAYNLKSKDFFYGNYYLDTSSSIEELIDGYSIYIEKINFWKNDVKDDMADVYIVDKKENINVIVTYSYWAGEVTYMSYKVNCNYWLRITINFIVILVGVFIAKKLEGKTNEKM